MSSNDSWPRVAQLSGHGTSAAATSSLPRWAFTGFLSAGIDSDRRGRQTATAGPARRAAGGNARGRGSGQAAGKTHLAARTLANCKRLIAEGVGLNPLPLPTGKPGALRPGPARARLRRLDLYQDDVLRFANNFGVPFNNNQAVRDVRMVKLQQKVSGC